MVHSCTHYIGYIYRNVKDGHKAYICSLLVSIAGLFSVFFITNDEAIFTCSCLHQYLGHFSLMAALPVGTEWRGMALGI